jgi:hypothetical protein
VRLPNERVFVRFKDLDEDHAGAFVAEAEGIRAGRSHVREVNADSREPPHAGQLRNCSIRETTRSRSWVRQFQTVKRTRGQISIEVATVLPIGHHHETSGHHHWPIVCAKPLRANNIPVIVGNSAHMLTA